MPKLIVNPNSPAAWEIQLKPGLNLIWRGAANDFKIADPSVSGSHCQIAVTDAAVTLTDMGSTNGTFVNRAPIKQAVLNPGQTIHFGGVEVLYCGDGSPPPMPAPVPVARAIPTARAVAAPVATIPPPTAAPPPPRPVYSVATARVAAPQAAAVEEVPVLAPPPPAPVIADGPHQCKFHPKTPARFFCAQCHNYFCDLCVTTRTVAGATSKTCRHCGVECTPVQVQVTRPVGGSRRFFSRLPSVFAYPFRGGGLLVLIIATIVFSALDFISGGFAIFAKIFAIGYLFSFMQTIIHSTAAEDEEMPGMPGLDDIFGNFMRLVSAVTFSFGPAIGLLIYAFVQEESVLGPMMIACIVFGCIYFPMALLAVAIKDAIFAANPLIVVPSIMKVFLQYLIAVVLLGAVFGLRHLGDMMLPVLFPRGLTTKSMAELAAMLATQAFWSFVGIYLLTINMRILGLLYLANKEKLGWIGR